MRPHASPLRRRPLRPPGRPFNALLTLLLAFPLVSVSFCRREAKGPIVIYLIDTLRADRLSLYGGRRDTAPAASDLAKEGVTFANAYCISTWTRPSVATLFTSALPSQVDALNRYGRLRDSAPTLPALLRTKGWRTAAFIANGNVFDPRLGFERGFDVFRATATVGGKRTTAKGTVDLAVSYIEKQVSPHFFLYVHVIDPHQPITLEPSYQALFSDSSVLASTRERALLEYDRSIRQADDQFQRVMDALKRKGWWRDAMAIYTADHGEEFYEHGYQGHGMTIFEEELRIPLVVKYPGNRDAGTRRLERITLADLLPTIAEVTRVPKSSRWIGTSLCRPIVHPRSFYFTEDLDNIRVFGLLREYQKFVVQLYPRFERTIYDLKADPTEQHGRSIPCGGSTDSFRDLLERYDGRHTADIAEYPGLTLEKIAKVPLVVDLRVNLAELPEPFLTAEDVCRYSPWIQGTRLQVTEPVGAEARYSLKLTTNWQGDAPSVRFSVSGQDGHVIDLGRPDSPVRVQRVEARFLKGRTTDELWYHLKSLGYLAGGQNAKGPP